MSKQDELIVWLKTNAAFQALRLQRGPRLNDDQRLRTAIEAANEMANYYRAEDNDSQEGYNERNEALARVALALNPPVNPNTTNSAN